MWLFSEACVRHKVAFQVQRVTQLCSGAAVARMPLRVVHFWLKSTAVWESVAIVLLSLALQAPVMLPPPFFPALQSWFLRVLEFWELSLANLWSNFCLSACTFTIWRMPEVPRISRATRSKSGRLGGDKQLFCESRETGLFSSSWYRSRITNYISAIICLIHHWRLGNVTKKNRSGLV